jgi:hypothetical protein
MSSLEERLARDITAVTGGVVVTESDLQEARDVLEHNMDERRRGRRRTAAALVAAAVFVPLVGVAVAKSVGSDRSAPPLTQVSPSTQTEGVAHDPDLWLTGRAPTTDLVRGVWRQDNGGVQVRFSADGTFSSDHLGHPFTDPGLVGTWLLTGDRITIDVTGGSAGCAGETFVLRVSLVKKGVLRDAPTEPAPTRCGFLDETWGALEQVLPTSSAVAGFRTSDKEGWKPWPRHSQLDGLWIIQGGGYAVELGTDGTYVVADRSGEPADRGRWSHRGTELTLTSSAQSVECSQGDRLVWSHVEQVYLGTYAMRGLVQDDTCGAPWAATDLVKIPDDRIR